MKFTNHKLEPASMQLAPMCDILFLLLSFFIVSYQFTKAETDLKVAVPTAEEGAETSRRRDEIMVNVLQDGTIRVENVTVDLNQLFERLSSVAKLNDSQPVRVRGDRDVPFQHIVGVVDTCQKAGIWNISFATQRPEPARR